MAFTVKVENKFTMARRDIQVRRKSWGKILEEQRVSCPASEYGAGEQESKPVKLYLGEVDGEEDYLEISVDKQQEELGPCKTEIRSNGPVTFIPPGEASITVIPSEDVETHTALRIPSGPPTWKLEIMRPLQTSSEGEDAVPGLIPRDEGSTIDVTVGDDPPGEGDYS
jgi:hypothetical protein